MVRRRLGNTGLMVSPIGFGAFKIGRNLGAKYAQTYNLPDDAAVDFLLNGVLDLGVNLIDTAPAYGTSEERIGRAISHRRDEFILSTKVGEQFIDGSSHYDYSDAATRASIERSLSRLHTDRLDIVFVHSNGEDEHIIRDTGVLPALAQLKSQGLIGSIGFSGKTVAGAALAMDRVDVLMVEYHAKDDSHADVIRQAASQGISIVVKKPLASGSLPATAAIQFVLRNPGVASAIVGGLNLNHIRDNIRAADSIP